MNSILKLQQFDSMSAAELDRAYGSGQANQIPEGVSRGRALFFRGTPWVGAAARFASVFWQGKVIRGTDLINRVLGLRAVRADVYVAESWFDGKPSIIVDYSKKSWVSGKIRDEIRQVSPGIYLGKAYWRSPQPAFLLDFALDFRASS